MSVIHRCTGQPGDLTWDGVAIKTYGEGFAGITRQVFVGPQEGAPHFAMRYFRLEPGTSSNREQHPHEHGVLILHGRARLQINETYTDVGPYDAIFISGNDLHQFVVVGDEPFGFVCVVPAA